MNTPKNTNETASASQNRANCVHCGRGIIEINGIWVDPQATGDDEIWREVCDSHDTFTAEHEPAADAPEAPYKPYYDRHNDGLPAPQAKRGLQPQAQHAPQIAIGKMDGALVDQNGFYIHDRSDYEQTKREIVRRYNSADKLAEALRKIRGATHPTSSYHEIADRALAQWEGEGK